MVVQKTSIFATSTWFVMVTLKHTQLCGMFTVAVCDTCNKYENMDRQSNLNNGRSGCVSV